MREVIRLRDPKRKEIVSAWEEMVRARGRRLLEDLKITKEDGHLKIVFVFTSGVTKGFAKCWIRAVVDSLGVELELGGYPHVRDIYGTLKQFGPRRKRRVFTKHGSVADLAA